MTEKEEAENIFRQFYEINNGALHVLLPAIRRSIAKQSALIHVNNILVLKTQITIPLSERYQSIKRILLTYE